MQKITQQKEVREFLTAIDLQQMANKPNNAYCLPFVDEYGKFQGYKQLDQKVDSTWQVMSTDSLNSQLLPIVSGG